VAYATTLASGLVPDSFTRAPLITTVAAPPSFRPGALPAVIIPPLSLVTGPSFARPSTVVSARTDSSLETTSGSPFRCGIDTATISFEKVHAACAAEAFCWLLTENSSSRWRVSFAFSAVYCASSIMWQSLNEHHSPSITTPSRSVESPRRCPSRPLKR